MGHRSIMKTLILAFALLNCRMSAAQQLTVADRFEIFTIMNLHQAYIDNNASCSNCELYASLYWPDASFRVIDPDRDATMTGDREIRSNYDYAHSVFPLAEWRHSMGVFEIYSGYLGPNGSLRADAYWKWRVDWRANTTGVVSTGTYTDVFEKRGEVWKTLQRTSRDDANWPLYLFAPYVANENNTYVSSCGDT